MILNEIIFYMDKEKARKLDGILDDLPKNGEMLGSNESSQDYIRLLESYGYVKVMGGDGYIIAYYITNEGIAFLGNGGFSKVWSDQQDKSDDRKLDRKYKITSMALAKIALAVSIISLILSIYSLVKR